MATYIKRRIKDHESASTEVSETVSRILREIEQEGSAAIKRWSHSLDAWSPDKLTMSKREIEKAIDEVPDHLRSNIDFAREQVENFARLQLGTISELEVETMPGVVLGHRVLPIEAVGSYTPGGRYPLIASAIMTVSVPKVAGVSRVVACGPPSSPQGMHPAQLYAMTTCGADTIVCLGGVQALAAMAFGMPEEDLGPVDMIVGAGNVYVAEAKRQLFGRVGIDLLAGPTEIAVIADATANPDLVAADLLGQAEHGPNSPAIAIVTSKSLGQRIATSVQTWLEYWPTAAVAGKAWADFGEIVICDGDEEAASICDGYAPEHVEVQTSNPDWYLSRLRNYGSLFLGDNSTVTYGDKSIGVNHVLPTGRAARYTGGLWVGKFLKTVTYERVTTEGSQVIAPPAAAISDAEGMAGHALSARLRLVDNIDPVTDSPFSARSRI